MKQTASVPTYQIEFNPTPYPQGLCSACGRVEVEKKGMLCEECQTLRESWSLTKSMKARGYDRLG